MAEITSAHVRRWYADMCDGERPSQTTVAKIYRLMRTILGTAVEDELIPKNPCSIKGAGVEKSAERPVRNSNPRNSNPSQRHLAIDRPGSRTSADRIRPNMANNGEPS